MRKNLPSDNVGDISQKSGQKYDENYKKEQKKNLTSQLQCTLLAFAAGIKLNSKIKFPRSTEPENWSDDELMSLFGELLQVKAFLENMELKTKTYYENGQRIIEEKNKNVETETPSKRYRFKDKNRDISFRSTSLDMNFDYTHLNKFTPNSNKRRKSRNTDIDNVENESNDNYNQKITADTLWETVDLFFKQVNDISFFDKVLSKTNLSHDLYRYKSRINEPVGKHYSLILPLKAEFRTDSIKRDIKFPQPPTTLISSSNEVHHNLLSALIPIVMEKDEQENNNDNTGSKSRNFGFKPSIATVGFSPWSSMNFVSRLKFELVSLGLCDDSSFDNMIPINKDILEVFEKYKATADLSNNMKAELAEIIRSKKDILYENARMANNWEKQLTVYLENKPPPPPPKDKKK